MRGGERIENGKVWCRTGMLRIWQICAPKRSYRWGLWRNLGRVEFEDLGPCIISPEWGSGSKLFMIVWGQLLVLYPCWSGYFVTGRLRGKAAVTQEEAGALNVELLEQLSLDQHHFSPERTTLPTQRETYQKASFCFLVMFCLTPVLWIINIM